MDDVAFGMWGKDSSFPRMYGHICQKGCGMEDLQSSTLKSEVSAKKKRYTGQADKLSHFKQI